MKSIEDRMRELLARTSSRANTENTSSDNSDDTDICQKCGKEAICGGMGMIRYDVPMDDWRFGQMFRCPNNRREEDTVYQERLREIGNLSAFANKTLNNFDVQPKEVTNERHLLSLQSALQAARDYAKNRKGWILFEGTYGCGKTHLAAAIGNIRLMYGEDVLLITVPDLLDHLRAAYGPSSEIGYDDTFNQLRNATVLILDDLGVENPSPWAQEKLFQLLNHRYTNRLSTVITTNNDINDLDPRIRSRLMDGTMVSRVKINAPDYRSLRASDTSHQLHTSLAHYASMTFENFEVDKYASPQESRNLKNILGIVRKYLERHEEAEFYWLVLAGRSGSGKTHLAAAAAVKYADKGIDVIMISMADLLDYLRLTYDPKSKASYEQRLHQMRNVSFLVIDDLALHKASDWGREKVLQILEYRYLTRRLTMMTIPGKIENQGERLSTRVLDADTSYIHYIGVDDSYAIRKLSR